jgi:hypothetical protein
VGTVGGRTELGRNLDGQRKTVHEWIRFGNHGIKRATLQSTTAGTRTGTVRSLEGGILCSLTLRWIRLTEALFSKYKKLSALTMNIKLPKPSILELFCGNSVIVRSVLSSMIKRARRRSRKGPPIWLRRDAKSMRVTWLLKRERWSPRGDKCVVT